MGATEESIHPMDELIGKREPFLPLVDDMISREGYNAAISFIPRANDIILTTPPKTGTTWLQQIVHQLRSSSPPDMDFDDIYQAVPWVFLAHDLDMDICLDQKYEPRCFKSHQLLSRSWSGARYIVTVRDPVATLESWWEFAKMKKMPPVEGIDSIEDFVHIPLVMENMMFGGNIWVMIVVYEDMVKDLRGLLPKIADFMGLAPREPEVLDKVAAVCTKSFMMEHIEKFDETWTVQKLQEKGLAAVKASRVNETGSKDRFSPATVNLLQRLWEEKMTPFTGHKTYEDFVMGLKE